ncbi:MAG: hypothetical protein ACLRZ4_12385 [Eubacterium ramulus]|uniref:hypothetical protein n=1 Tax=Eubacterium ramulus TaxID=39490 RepID=UPI0039A3408E
MKQDYKKTTYACFIGYIVQAIVNSFVPLLFVTFQKTYQIPLTKITLLITINFVIQLLIDLLSAGFIDKIGYRASHISVRRQGWYCSRFCRNFSQIRLLAF